jgi:hypothetical protein
LIEPVGRQVVVVAPNKEEETIHSGITLAERPTFIELVVGDFSVDEVAEERCRRAALIDADAGAPRGADASVPVQDYRSLLSAASAASRLSAPRGWSASAHRAQTKQRQFCPDVAVMVGRG